MAIDRSRLITSLLLIVVVVLIGQVYWQSRRIAQMQASAEKMAAPVIDLLQIHNLVDWRTHLKTLRAWKEQGKVRSEGKEYVVQDGDVMEFRFNV